MISCLFACLVYSEKIFQFQEEQYCKWMAACKLASKGKTMADSSFETEVQALQKFLAMQKTTPSPEKVVVTPNQLDIQPEDFVSPRYYKKIKAKQVQSSLFLVTHISVQNTSTVKPILMHH